MYHRAMSEPLKTDGAEAWSAAHDFTNYMDRWVDAVASDNADATTGQLVAALLRGPIAGFVEATLPRDGWSTRSLEALRRAAEAAGNSETVLAPAD